MSHRHKLDSRTTENIYASLQPRRKYRAFTFKIKTLKIQSLASSLYLSRAQQHEGAWMKELPFTLDWRLLGSKNPLGFVGYCMPWT